MRVACLGLLVACLTGPALADAPSCFGARQRDKRNELQERILGQTRQRAASLCAQPNVQCDFRWLNLDKGNVAVMVLLAVEDGARCLYPLDGGYMEVYDRKGRFIRQVDR